jgi:hypothetical protein
MEQFGHISTEAADGKSMIIKLGCRDIPIF